MPTIELCASIAKLDEERRLVYGWASVITEKGEPVVDAQGDIIEADELERAATEFMGALRTAKAMHAGGRVGEVLHSLPLTKALAGALGLACDREGWIVGMRIDDDAVWSRVKDGTLGAFSIGGAARREPLPG